MHLIREMIKTNACIGEMWCQCCWYKHVLGHFSRFYAAKNPDNRPGNERMKFWLRAIEQKLLFEYKEFSFLLTKKQMAFTEYFWMCESEMKRIISWGPSKSWAIIKKIEQILGIVY